MDRIATLKRSATEAIGKHELPRALVLLNEALDLAPDDRALWTNRAYVHELRKAPADALSDAQRLLHEQQLPNAVVGSLTPSENGNPAIRLQTG